LQQKKEGNSNVVTITFFFLFDCSSANKMMAALLPLSPSFFLWVQLSEESCHHLLPFVLL